MKFALSIFLSLLIVVFSQFNYQERIIYLGQNDNVCLNGEKSDMMNLIVIVNDI